MTAEERAELEMLRQQHEAPLEGVGSGGGHEDLLHRLKTLPEHEAMALLLELRSEAGFKEVSSSTAARASLLRAMASGP